MTGHSAIVNPRYRPRYWWHYWPFHSILRDKYSRTGWAWPLACAATRCEKKQPKDVLPNVNRTQAAERAEKCRFCPWWPWPLTVHIDLQTHPSEGPNTSSMWIWCKSVQRFLSCFIHNQKTTDWRRQKQNLPQFTACGNNNITKTTIPSLQSSDQHYWTLKNGVSRCQYNYLHS